MTQAFPLQWPEGWPRTAPERRTYNWQLKRATLPGARQQLYTELRRLGATQIVLSTSIPLRKDGEFNADMRPCDKEPGVAIYFELRGRSMAMARDSYNIIEQNMRSLGMAVEYLRGLERHGGATMLERAFAGFAQLPPPAGAPQEEVIDWRKELGPIPDDMESYELLAIVEARYRMRAKRAHTDLGGDEAAMIRLNLAIAQAREELK